MIQEIYQYWPIDAIIRFDKKNNYFLPFYIFYTNYKLIFLRKHV